MIDALTLTNSATPTLATSPAAATDPGILVTAILSGAFLAALVTASINIWLARRASREEERNRVRTAFAEAFAAYSTYKEFPYAIRRRRADVPGEERGRLSEELRKIQADLAYHLAWTAAESKAVGEAYANLVQEMRAIAGAAMHEAWKAEPTNADNEMNIPVSVIDLRSLAPHEHAYMDAAEAHLRRLAPWWAR
jgi:metal-dependent amidase/aminoacylase/carboxypeptidase family protein